METQGPARRLLDWFAGDRRRVLALGGAAAAVAAVSITAGVLIVAGGDRTGPGPSPTPFTGECNSPTLIDQLSEGTGDGWERVGAPQFNDCFSLTPSSSDAGGVAIETEFVLVSKEQQDAAELVQRITTEPAVELQVAQEGTPGPSYRYRITPASPLAEGQVYRFTLLDKPQGQAVRSWAFQTQQPLRVVQTLPADQSTGVPTNVGVELTFSHDGITGAEERFQIEPATEGRFETHKRVLVFVPKELKKETLYTVTLKAGAGIPGSDQTMATDFRFQFETGASDRTGDTPGPPPLQFSRREWESSTADAPAVALFGADLSKTSTLPFTVYRFAGMPEFLAALDEFTAIPSWAYVSRARVTIATSGLEKVTTFDGQVHSQGEYVDRYVLFPEPLAQGLYLVESTFEDKPLQTLLQVTDVGAYASVSRTRVLVWTNDLATKGPLSGAAITSTGPAVSETTNADGIALFATPPDLVKVRPSYYGYSSTETSGNLIVTAADGRSAVVPLADVFSGYQYYGFREYGFAGDPNLYWRYLFTDRRLYHPADSVRFWGIARQRENAPASEQIEIQLTGNTFIEKGGTYGPVVVASTKVNTDALGTFMGQLPFQGVTPGYYNLEARAGDQTITASYIEIKDFVKPAYKLDVLPEKNAVITGETMNVKVKASFFDGTPAVKTQMLFRDGKNSEAALTTDMQGEATVPFDSSFAFGNPGGPYLGAYLTVAPTLAEEGEITGNAFVMVFPATITVDASTDYADGQGVLTGTVYSVDLSRINTGDQKDFNDYRGAPAAGRTVTITVMEQSYNKIEIGDVYDFIAKIVRKKYRYEPVSIPVGEFQGVSDGEGRIRITFPAEENKSYQIKMRTNDDAGRTFTADAYLYSGKDYYSDWPTLSGDQGPFKVGDQVSVTMAQGDVEYPAGGGNRYLFYEAQNGIRSFHIGESPEYSFSFAAEDIPDVTVVGVRFTGGTYVEATMPFTAAYDHAERELAITLAPKAEKYAPGDKAGLDVSVTDKSGRPVQAAVLLSAVDEAAFRAEGESFFGSLDILEGLYTRVPSGVYRTYASHQAPALAPSAERGGDGGARRDFRDVALFQQVSTDAAGHASVSFDLPDNLTSWRVTALAVTSDLYAGRATKLVPVTLPLFVDATLNTSYLVTDKPSVKVRAFGDTLTADDAVAVEVTSPTLFGDTLRASTTGFTPAYVALPPLSEGQHELHIKVNAAGQEDEIVRTITVVSSRLLHDVSHFDEVKAGDSFTPVGAVGGPTTIVISDHNRGQYYPVLSSLVWTYGDRLDQMLARKLAQDLMREYFSEEPAFPAEFRASSYQTTQGGLAIFPFADDDLALSSHGAALEPDMFGREALAQYLRNVLSDPDETREQAIIALYGLAGLGDPVLLDIQQAASAGDLTTRERLYLGLAAALLGDEGTAQGIYAGLLQESGERRGAGMRLNVGTDSDEILEATSLAAQLGALLGDDFAPLLFQYTTDNYGRETLVQLDQIAYLTYAMPRLSSEPVRVSYTVDGQAHEESLEHGTSVTVTLDPDGLAALGLQVIEGTAGVATSYRAALDPGSVKTDPAVSISRTYAGQSGAKVTMSEGDLVKITLTWGLTQDAVDGCYQVSDLLPSGLRPVTRLYERGVSDKNGQNIWYPYLVEGQRVSFCVVRDFTERTINYYARVVSTGTYAAEPVVMQSQKAQESIGFGDTLEVEIK